MGVTPSNYAGPPAYGVQPIMGQGYPVATYGQPTAVYPSPYGPQAAGIYTTPTNMPLQATQGTSAPMSSAINAPPGSYPAPMAVSPQSTGVMPSPSAIYAAPNAYASAPQPVYPPATNFPRGYTGLPGSGSGAGAGSGSTCPPAYQTYPDGYLRNESCRPN